MNFHLLMHVLGNRLSFVSELQQFHCTGGATLRDACVLVSIRNEIIMEF